MFYIDQANEDNNPISSSVITKQSEHTHVSQYIPTGKFIESYVKFNTLVKVFNALENHLDSFDNREDDLE